MPTQLSPRLEAKLEQIMANGHYESTDDALDAALRLLVQQERQDQELRALLDAAEAEVDKGNFLLFNHELIEKLKNEATENARQGRPINNDLIF